MPVDTKHIQTFKSFEQCFLEVVKPIEEKPKQSRKRLKVSSCVVTDQALVAELKRDEEDKAAGGRQVKKKRLKRDAKKTAKLEAEKVKVAEQSSNASYSESVGVDDVEELPLIPPCESNYRAWNSFNPPITKEEIIYL